MGIKLCFRNVEEVTTKYGSPLYAEKSVEFAPLLIFTAECDPLRDAGEAYGRRLWEAPSKLLSCAPWDIRTACESFQGCLLRRMSGR